MPLAIVTLLALAAAMAFFAAFPAADIALARAFYGIEGGSFDARFDRTLILLRHLAYGLPIAVLALAALLWLLGRTAWARGRLRPPSGRSLAFLALSLALGPGLIVNLLLKEVSHRPRPVQITEFGGTAAFKPWYAFDGGCEHNCSFVSGETAGAAWLAAPAALLPPPWRALAMAGAALITVAVALLRMAFGGHFASDTIGAALVTLAIILLVGRALRSKGPPQEL